MSFPTETPNISDGVDNHVYSAIKFGDWKIVRSEAAADPDKPALLTVSHQETGTDLKRSRSSLARFDLTTEDADGNLGTTECYIVVRRPVNVVSTTQATKAVAQLTSFLAISGYVAKFLAGEV